MKKILKDYYMISDRQNRELILSLMPRGKSIKILDLGCHDGEYTKKIAKASGSNNVWGLEIMPDNASKAKKNGIKVVIGDLEKKFPFRDNEFDVIHSNQVIEHVKDCDFFMKEVYRILKPGGVTIHSTENGSSWHNILASIMGWQIFSLTNFSHLTRNIGNPLSAHMGEEAEPDSWLHIRIWNYQGLNDYFKQFKYKKVKTYGAGYHPPVPFLDRFDPRHAHFIITKAVK